MAIPGIDFNSGKDSASSFIQKPNRNLRDNYLMALPSAAAGYLQIIPSSLSTSSRPVAGESSYCSVASSKLRLRRVPQRSWRRASERKFQASTWTTPDATGACWRSLRHSPRIRSAASARPPAVGQRPWVTTVRSNKTRRHPPRGPPRNKRQWCDPARVSHVWRLPKIPPKWI